jgi:hypothetical protein
VASSLPCQKNTDRQRAAVTRSVQIEEGFNGPEQVRRAILALMRIFLRRTVVWRKIFVQHLLHLGVRVLYYLDKITTELYAYSRNMFVKSAVKNKSTVPHFWEHLKVYKQEIDKEKEEKAQA